ncbi:MAG TPA: cupin domain-containing protein [Chloroflexota bacterium]|jgi:quercetin dioxygenase-like cupin family protein
MKVVKLSDIPKEPVEANPLFTGSQVYRQLIVKPEESQSFNFSVVAFSAGSRNKMHVHTSDQILIVTEGSGVVANDHEERQISQGDVVLIPAGENHWHGAPGATPMSHITVQAKGGTTKQVEA